MRKDEYGGLREWMYLAIFVPPGQAPPPREVLEKPEIRQYYENFGARGTDLALVAEANGDILGVAWVRVLSGERHGFGYYDAETPELALAVREDCRGCGIGTALLKALFVKLKAAGHRRVSLSVERDNRAAGLYRRLGFRVVAEPGRDYLMVLDLV